MVYRTTSTKRRRAGFTFSEMLVSLAIGSIMMIAVGSFGLFSAKSFASIANYVDLDATSRNALDRLTKDVRQVNRLVSNTSTNLVFEDSDGSSLEYVYSPSAQSLSRIKGGRTEVLLTECDALTFSTYQRNPIGGTYDQFPTANATTTKLINVSWRCTRDVRGQVFNTESVQTSKIVIRKQ